MKKTIAIAAMIAALGGTVALAQGMHGQDGEMGMGMGPGMGGAGMMPDFATLDADADGLVTPEEVAAAQAARFAAADTDASGGLSAAEMVAAAEAARLEMLNARTAERLAMLDANADGEVQADEMGAQGPSPDQMFTMLDADNDGAISTAEFEAGHMQMADHRAEHEGRGWGFWNRDGHGQRHNN